METTNVIELQKLRKEFGPLTAVADVSLTVSRGQVFGFLGPNGAGKTTTIGMLLGLLHPTAGQIRLFGETLHPNRTAVLRRVGSLVGSPALIPYLSARQNLEMMARLNPNLPPTRVDETLANVGLSEAAHRKAGAFSTGMKQRLGLAVALLHQPELLILDEPTNGMDPAGMREVRDLLRSLADQGMTVFLSSHLLHEVEQVCDHVAVLSKGRLVAQGPVASLLSGEEVLRVKVASPARAAEVLSSKLSLREVTPNGHFVTLRGSTATDVVSCLVAAGIVPEEITSQRPDLESLFLELTEKGA
jgi:ABC-type multidrug transport system ATPase subunit